MAQTLPGVGGATSFPLPCCHHLLGQDRHRVGAGGVWFAGPGEGPAWLGPGPALDQPSTVWGMSRSALASALSAVSPASQGPELCPSLS